MPLGTGEPPHRRGLVHTRGKARSDTKKALLALCGEPHPTSQGQHSPSKSSSDVPQRLHPRQGSWALSSPEFKGCHCQKASPAQPLSSHQGPAGLPLIWLNYRWGNSSPEAGNQAALGQWPFSRGVRGCCSPITPLYDFESTLCFLLFAYVWSQ